MSEMVLILWRRKTICRSSSCLLVLKEWATTWWRTQTTWFLQLEFLGAELLSFLLILIFSCLSTPWALTLGLNFPNMNYFSFDVIHDFLKVNAVRILCFSMCIILLFWCLLILLRILGWKIFWILPPIRNIRYWSWFITNTFLELIKQWCNVIKIFENNKTL